ncbi:MAG: molybdenum cofactor guanylyltransferase [Clostridiales bacterium]|nr:molybdenum cofactor guanylyltransferase [Clostridiales bacterium]
MERRISAGILAGGKSKRMGEDKARLWHGGETFLAHLLRELREFDEVLLSVEDRRAWADAPCRVVEDQLPDFGPVEGIYQLLRAARNPYVLVTAIDLQCLTALALQTLAGQIRPGVCCLVPCRDAWLEPLCSIYHKDALPVLEQMRSAGVRRPRALFDCVPTRYIEFADLGWNDSMVKNVNTRGEYEALLREEDSKETKKSCCTVKKEIDRI